MIKVVAVITRKSGLDREEFLRYWQDDHPAYVRKLTGIRRYVQNPAVDGYRPWPYDGVAELWFDSVRDVAIAFEGAAADALREHEEHFIGELNWFLSEERDVALAPEAGE
jgi:uncharacterized protein (TIGR02118 family)